MNPGADLIFRSKFLGWGVQWQDTLAFEGPQDPILLGQFLTDFLPEVAKIEFLILVQDLNR